MKLNAHIARYAISNGLLAAKELPRRIKFADWGDSTGVGNRRIRVNPLTVERLPRMQAEKGWDRVALDFEHNTVEGTPEFERTKEPRAVAAYGRVVAVANDGLYLDEIEWPPHGVTFGREYCDLSPAPVQTADGTIVGVHSVALCRHGVIDGLSAYSVEIPEGGKQMDWKKWLCGLLGVPEETADADLQTGFVAKVKAFCAEAVAELKTQVDALAALKAGEQITALSAEVATLKTSVATYAAEIEKRDRQDILAQAAREGKVVALSAEAVGKLSVTDLRDHVAKLAVTVPMDRRTPPVVQALSVEGSISDLDKTLARKLGYTEDEVRKANGLK